MALTPDIDDFDLVPLRLFEHLIDLGIDGKCLPFVAFARLSRVEAIAVFIVHCGTGYWLAGYTVPQRSKKSRPLKNPSKFLFFLPENAIEEALQFFFQHLYFLMRSAIRVAIPPKLIPIVVM